MAIVTSFKHDVPVPLPRRRAPSGAAAVEEGLLRAVLAEAPDGILVADRRGRCVEVNARLCEIVGRPRAELLSLPLVELVVPADAGRLRSLQRQFARPGSIHGGEWRLRSGHGGEVTVQTSARTLASGQCLVFVRDVTGMRESEGALRSALRSRDDVLRTVSHDLRGPLQNIRLTAQQIGEQIDSGLDPLVLRASLERILRASGGMARLVEDLLDVASIDAGRLALRPAVLRPDALVKEALDAHQAQAQAHGIALTMAAVTSSTILADQGRLLQALSNVIGNALKFTPTGGIVLVCADDDADDAVRISVVDSGPGLSHEHAARVFEPFWQSRQADQRGRGLGLPIAKSIVEAHGGRIWLESELGRGTIVCFTVPKAPPTS